MESLITVTIRSTHYYLIDTGQGFLMMDAGWAGSLLELKSQLRRYQMDLAQIHYVMITHHHPDHAGLAQEIKHVYSSPTFHSENYPCRDNKYKMSTAMKKNTACW